MLDWLRKLSGSSQYKKLVIAENELRANMPFLVSFIKIYSLIKGVNLKATITHIDLGEVLFEIETEHFKKFHGLSRMLNSAIGHDKFWIHPYVTNEIVRINIKHMDAKEIYEI